VSVPAARRLPEGSRIVQRTRECIGKCLAQAEPSCVRLTTLDVERRYPVDCSSCEASTAPSRDARTSIPTTSVTRSDVIDGRNPLYRL